VVDDVEVVVGAEREAAGISEPAVAVPLRAPFPEKAAVSCEVLDAVVAVVGDVDVAVRRDCNAARVVELAVTPRRR
jgi:hypothetical protein